MSFGALRKAQKALARTSTVEDSDDEDGSEVSESGAESDDPVPRLGKGKEKEGDTRTKKEVPKRKNKHA